MTTTEFLEIVRQKIGQAINEVNGELPEFTDVFLLDVAKTTNFILKALGVDTKLVINSKAQTITPDPFDDNFGIILAFGAASDLVADDLINKLNRGELGVSFSSGATQITTNQAAITLKTSANELKRKFNLLLTSFLSTDPDGVIERLQ